MLVKSILKFCNILILMGLKNEDIFSFRCCFDLTPQLTQLTTVLTYPSLAHESLSHWRISRPHFIPL